jgi:hypothetical protein
MYLWLARLVIVVHALVVLVLICGGVAIIAGRFSRLRLALRLIIIATFMGYLGSELFLHDCILTRVEKHLRSLSRVGSAYSGSFLDNYSPFLFQVISGVTLLSASYLWWKRPRTERPRR